MTEVAAIVLAAGLGTRFGLQPKLLAPFSGRPLVANAIAAALASSLRPVLVITGYRGEEVTRVAAELGATVVPNPRFAEGLSGSLRVGFAALPESAAAAAVLLGDMPRIEPDLLDALAAAWRGSGGPSALVPTYAGRRGNPVILSRELAPEIARLSGDVGAGPLLRDRPGVVEWPVSDDAVALDIDTADALAAAQASTTPSSTAE